MAADDVSVEELASWLDRTPRRVQQLADEGVLTKKARGKYQLKANVIAFIRYMTDLAEGRGTEMDEEKLLTARILRRRKELELAELEGTMVSVQAHEIAMGEAFALVRQRIRNLPGQLAQRLVGLEDPKQVVAILVPAVDRALVSLIAEAGELETNDELTDEVPGLAALRRANVTTFTELKEKLEDLTNIPGIGAKTAGAIIEFVSNGAAR